ncbi:Serine/threonine kinase [Elasticomyces elasticus]|nr:Serine/threonine kinase [Elasticomyces elasticus]
MGNSNGKPVIFTDAVNLNHFRLLRVVGKGAFGKVRIVERRDTGLTFALKYIRKDEIVRSESVRNILRERRMLEHLNHPFLCNLRYSFQDMEYMYIIVDLMTGGDLRFHITRKSFTEEAVRFWIAELGCALRYIHKHGIVHRDLKPDNVLLDFEGHVHLADFNVASDFTPARPLTSKSGTLAYLAPEVYIGKGYSSEVDWWSLGVVFYECIYNRRPFDANHHDALAQSIIRAEPPFPVTSPPVSMPCLHAISSLLEKDKTLRIGAAGFTTFSDNPFFRPLDFEALERKELDPVFVPSSEKTNFDATYDLEELLLEEAPLEARSRKQKPRPELRNDATEQEIRNDELHRMIEAHFEPFDYTTLPPERKLAPPMVRTATDPGPSPKRIAPSAPPKQSRKSTLDPSSHKPTPSQSIPASRSQTPGNTSTSRARSSIHSPNGSPPLHSGRLSTNLANSPPSIGSFHQQTEQQPAPPQAQPQPQPHQKVRTLRYDDTAAPAQQAPAPPPSTTSNPRSTSRQRRPRASTRSKSMGVDPPNQPSSSSSSHWADTDRHSQNLSSTSAATLVGSSAAAAGEEGGGGRSTGRPTGMLGFLTRKKGRDGSPRAGKEKERERGVLGKEGARVVVGNG